MNLGPNTIASTYQYVLNQSGNSITLGNGGAVSWASNGLLLNTGNQLISGIKTFADDSYMRKNLTVSGDCLLGNSALSVNSFGSDASLNNFGENASTNNFGAYAFNYIGYSSPMNYFGQGAVDNDFGRDSTTNNFGLGSATNNFGLNATDNNFGGAPETLLGTVNSFGTYAQNSFGTSGSNIFGLDASNEYGSGLFAGPIRLFLPRFSGSSSQAGQTGELKVSGSGLYICTGANAWGRVFISSF